MKKILLVLLSSFLVINVFSQAAMKTRKWRKTEQDSLEKAQAIFESKNYLVALSYFEKILSNHPNELYLRYVVGICGLYRSDMHEKSLEYLTEAYSKSKKIESINFDLARAQHYNGKFDDALVNIDLSLKQKKPTLAQKKEAFLLKEFCNNGKDLVAAPLNAKIENIGAPVNTANSEYSPIISSDESVMMFTYVGEESTGGKQDDLNRPDSTGNYFEDVFVTHKENGKWGKPKSIGENINTNSNDAPLAISNDEQKLFIYKDDGTDGGDIYMSILEGNVWSVPEKLKGDVNSPYWEGSVTISADEKTLFFASDRPGGFGGRDLYQASLLPDGSWGNVRNMGIEINSIYDDDAPFIHPDGKTLFYSTQGLKSMGYNDIFVARFSKADSSWSKPENIGYPINTTDDDRYFVLNASGTHGYYSSAKSGGYGQQDIYTVEMPANFPKPVVETVKGNVTLDDKPKQAQVLVDIISSNKNYGSFHSNSSTGKYLVNILPGNNYKFTFKLKGFPDIEKTIDASSLKTFTENVLDIKFITKVDTVVNIQSSASAENNQTDKKDKKAAGESAKAENSKTSASTKTNYVGKNFAIKSDSKIPIEKITPDDDPAPAPAKVDKVSIIETKVASKFGDVSKEGLVYKIQLGALKSPENFNSGKLKGLGKIDKNLMDDGLTRITIGSFKTLNEAIDLKKKVRESGFPDAFVTATYQGKRIYLTELEKQGIIQFDK